MFPKMIKLDQHKDYALIFRAVYPGEDFFKFPDFIAWVRLPNPTKNDTKAVLIGIYCWDKSHHTATLFRAVPLKFFLEDYNWQGPYFFDFSTGYTEVMLRTEGIEPLFDWVFVLPEVDDGSVRDTPQRDVPRSEPDRVRPPGRGAKLKRRHGS